MKTITTVEELGALPEGAVIAFEDIGVPNAAVLASTEDGPRWWTTVDAPSANGDGYPHESIWSCYGESGEPGITLVQYQEHAEVFAIYPLDNGDQYLVAGLAGEVGELASIFAKHWRGDGDLNHDHAAAELGDILWFIAMLAERLDTDLSDVAQNNLNKLADRAVRGKLKGNGDNR